MRLFHIFTGRQTGELFEAAGTDIPPEIEILKNSLLLQAVFRLSISASRGKL